MRRTSYSLTSRAKTAAHNSASPPPSNFAAGVLDGLLPLQRPLLQADHQLQRSRERQPPGLHHRSCRAAVDEEEREAVCVEPERVAGR
ncbi:MAG: hypothetical protein AAGI52_06660 [Bacteroidota bacterium]